MIRNLDIIHVSPGSFTSIIGGNEGEEELAISMSPGQDGRTALIVTAMSVDGGGHILIAAAEAHARILEAQLWPTLRGVMINWAFGGIKPTDEEGVGLYLEIDAVIAHMKKVYGDE